MSYIISVGTAVPPYEISQETAKNFSKILFKDHFKDIDRLLRIFDHTQITKRHFCVPIEWFEVEHTFEEKNMIYVKNAIELSKQAIFHCLKNTPFATEDIDHILFISSTGLSTPSIDAYLFNDPDIHFNPHIKRTPIWGLGCAGGAAGLSRAMEYSRAFPNDKVLVVSLEIGELAFLRNDLSKSNLVATSLFGDGAAAVLIVGDQVLQTDAGLKMIDSQSTIWKNSLDVMGWDVRNNGLKVIFSKDIPSIVQNELKPNVDQFLLNHHLTLSDLQFFILHPGGTKIIEAYENAFQITEQETMITRQILNQYGNMSSPTVLFVLQALLKSHPPKNGHGILIALGPGFSSEIILLEWMK
ncbi:type III polyketide synthase [Tepidibacillus sp. HK-1]|uniref:type III polyketide synthase n=1 Tax=Tepidibacillus sp. HK-1 TaxID=1883407 RepID=UPI000852E1A5|nr:3-oxoacyl-[acyl-carrier-protein] synthase III C-terminal domain-containing protein [Tepidibacillus sp. HK-1]GBF10341.1 alpha-pyrone synthesis polyketide synthase-like Pks11 [Tepidibacillus sp. HK-1]